MYIHFFTYLAPDIIVMINFALQLRPYFESLVVMETSDVLLSKQIIKNLRLLEQAGLKYLSGIFYK